MAMVHLVSDLSFPLVSKNPNYMIKLAIASPKRPKPSKQEDDIFDYIDAEIKPGMLKLPKPLVLKQLYRPEESPVPESLRSSI